MFLPHRTALLGSLPAAVCMSLQAASELAGLPATAACCCLDYLLMTSLYTQLLLSADKGGSFASPSGRGLQEIFYASHDLISSNSLFYECCVQISLNPSTGSQEIPIIP